MINSDDVNLKNLKKVVKLLEDLVKIKSVSGFEDRISEYVIKYFQKNGFDVYKDNVGNVIVKRDPKLWVATHLDTIEILSEFKFDGKYCYGTGVCDAKGCIASILLACENSNFSVVLFTDEEENGIGSKNFNEKPSKCIVMEPTELKIAKKHWGTVEMYVKVKGLAAHGATPWAGINAFERANKMLKELEKIKVEDCILTVLGINTPYSKIYAIPELCDVNIEFLFRNNYNLLDILNVAEKYGEVKLIEATNAFESKEVHKLLENAFIKTGFNPRFTEMTSWTDAVNLYEKGWDVVVFGPGKLEYCHTKREKIKPVDILVASKILENLIL